jgi:tryptophan synthase alpha chain
MRDDATPVVLMGYYNPIYAYGVDKFLTDAKSAGVDGLIVVDLPMEEDDELKLPADRVGIDFIRLVSPATDDARMARILPGVSGFVYYVAITGITGTASADAADVTASIARIRKHTELPVAVGFGVRTPEHVAAMGESADAVVVGSAIVQRVADKLDPGGKALPELASSVLEFVSTLARGARETVKETQRT